tara:strand:- start:351 stop:722 length:372 start_codon:yes stop_codon:yes gene_type:complete
MHYKDPYAWDKAGLKKAFQDLQRLLDFMEDTTILGNHEEYGKLIEGFTSIDDELASMLDESNRNEYDESTMMQNLEKLIGKACNKDGKFTKSEKNVNLLFDLCINLKSKTQIEEWKDAVRPKR